MLGMRQNDAPVRGEFAREIRMQLWRVATGNKNEADRRMADLHNEVQKGKQYKITWSK